MIIDKIAPKILKNRFWPNALGSSYPRGLIKIILVDKVAGIFFLQLYEIL